ncbi:MAG: DUF1295 domain-containing protein [Myxococcota bacterium]
MPSWLPFETHPLYAGALLAVAVFGGITFPLLFVVTAPYGRHLRAGWGPTLPARLGWVLMELPSPVGFAAVFLNAPGTRTPAGWLLFALFELHYLYRTFVFPFRMRGEGKRKPALTVVMAFLFNCANGPANAFAIVTFGAHLQGLADARLLAGTGLFLLGWALNQHADHVLLTLRAPGESGYKIPQRGLHRWVASPNYFGEILEWGGFALAAATAPALLFLLFTVANLAPRARANLRWYRQRFAAYPPERRALGPFLW